MPFNPFSALTSKLFGGLLVERTRYNSALQGWFSFVLGLVVFGAEWLRAKWGGQGNRGR